MFNTVRVKMLDGSIRDCYVTDWSDSAMDGMFGRTAMIGYRTRQATHVRETSNPIEAVISADFEYVERLAR